MTIDQERDTLERRALNVRSRLEDRIHEVGRRVEETKQALDLARVIRANPLVAAGVALGLGALIGLAFGGKRGPIVGALGTLITGTALQVGRQWLSTHLGDVLKGEGASPLDQVTH